MSMDENSKGSTDDSGVILNASYFSQSSTASTDFKNVALGNNNTSLPRKRSLIHDEDESADENDENTSEPISRKEKSLGKLCKRFLLAMDEESQTGQDVHLETVAKKMSVEKRRIYDIVNVMEALEAMSKTNKSYYRWHGLARLPILMAQLAKESLKENLPTKIMQVEQAMCSFTELAPIGHSQQQQNETVGSLVGESQGSTTSSSSKSLSQNDSFKSGTCRDRNGKNSLAQLCRRFLMVLLCNPKDKRRVSLDVASTVLIKDPESEGFDPPSRSRCRRLYDIANVLVAMGLIKKVHYLFGTKKIPLFVYCGPEPDESPEKAAASMAEFMLRNGLIEAAATAAAAQSSSSQPPASKLRRISSDSKPLQSSQNLLTSSSFQRCFSEIQKSQLAYANSSKLPNISEITNHGRFVKAENKENVSPKIKSELFESDLPKPVPRPLHRVPFGALNPISMAPLNWNIEAFQQRNPFGIFSTNYSVSSILGGRKTPTKSYQSSTTTLSKMTNSPKAFRPVISRLSPPQSSTATSTSTSLAAAAMILTGFCNG
uniref:E2F/DP family winged-helix DNA-binding domain-containing protein n=1 Tax=Panagrolaimus sp. ES5 TaxID=591445 RepID=A0AC34FG01_9BILA